MLPAISFKLNRLFEENLSMLRYETLILTRPEITEDETTKIERCFDTHLTGDNGHVTTFDKWGKLRLSYPVKGNDYGSYILVRFESTEAFITKFIKELETFFKIKCSDFVIRYVTTKLAKDAPTTYFKPEAIDSTRSASVDSFLKENKMDGLLSLDEDELAQS
jgi:ribosomal protein S6